MSAAAGETAGRRGPAAGARCPGLSAAPRLCGRRCSRFQGLFEEDRLELASQLGILPHPELRRQCKMVWHASPHSTAQRRAGTKRAALRPHGREQGTQGRSSDPTRQFDGGGRGVPTPMGRVPEVAHTDRPPSHVLHAMLVAYTHQPLLVLHPTAPASSSQHAHPLHLHSGWSHEETQTEVRHLRAMCALTTQHTTPFRPNARCALVDGALGTGHGPL